MKPVKSQRENWMGGGTEKKMWIKYLEGKMKTVSNRTWIFTYSSNKEQGDISI